MKQVVKTGLMLVLACFAFSACSSGPEVKQEAYAQLKNQRTFEYEFPSVWAGIEETVRNWSVSDRDPKNVDAVQMRKLRHRTLETNWMYSRSTDKYVEYRVNDLPRKTYLQTRVRYEIDAQAVLGGVKVTINTDEEIERLKDDGSSAGWDSVDQVDGALASNLLDKINMSILAAPNTSSPDEI